MARYELVRDKFRASLTAAPENEPAGLACFSLYLDDAKNPGEPAAGFVNMRVSADDMVTLGRYLVQRGEALRKGVPRFSEDA